MDNLKGDIVGNPVLKRSIQEKTQDLWYGVVCYISSLPHTHFYTVSVGYFKLLPKHDMCKRNLNTSQKNRTPLYIGSATIFVYTACTLLKRFIKTF